MKSFLKRYSDQNPERFNKEFILSRDKLDILENVKDIFKSLEILDEIKVEEVTLERDESTFGPVIVGNSYYKPILPSRLDKIHYKVRITPMEGNDIKPIELGKTINKKLDTSESFIREGDIFINKLVDNCFYINEGCRYFLIYQIVDNATYGTENAVSLKSLGMPIMLRQHQLTVAPEYMKDPVTLKSMEVHLFLKKVSPLLYFMGKESFNLLVNMDITPEDNTIEKWTSFRSTELINRLNSFFNTDFKFSSNSADLIEDGRTIFGIKPEKTKDEKDICYVSVSDEKLQNDNLTKAVLGCLLDIRNETKKKRIVFSYDNLISPWFWIDTLSSFFTKNPDYLRKINKVRTTLISLSRLMDDTNRKILKINEADKEDTLTIIRYLMKNFDELCEADSQDLANKRLRLHEYQLYPLRKYFSDQIYRVLNSPTRSKAVLDRIFSSLSPMFIIKQTVLNELLRYYNAANDFNLYTSLLKFTFRGPQSLSKTVTMEQRDLHPSYTGRLSLIASPAGDPGMSGNIVPMIEEYNYYLGRQDDKE